ncbi:probable NADH dehydrogenase [ubiquinone] 1 alpha subcomplex subunit 12 [Macrosteles quadrilineatus]|uniref:probable NADH dehydrogenase [ubiquinone] 1 alpha subcomplex subunit 12 n=1 Tax=Macrosteles quadrilineatus TaxID=74068 RepID=UPI0023E2DF4D|nr:probable NADH dehydrogenase [ubiquinone] 1 alpha subcomplex subunit 12 [Macrosteles quadrilineatus]
MSLFSSIAKTLRHHGGLWGCLKSSFIRDTLKHGTLVGTDRYGNRYYQNNDYFFLRNRWVEYADHVGLQYDASQVPPEWFGWLHHRTDLPPDQEPFRPQYHWMLPREENMSGTPLEYVPYTTTRPKVEAWVPPRGGGGTETSPGEAAKGGCSERAGETMNEEGKGMFPEKGDSSGCGAEKKDWKIC